jgi:hypothetical protein
MITQSNSKIFTSTVFGDSSDGTQQDLVGKDIGTQETYLASSSYSNLGTKLPKIPSNQRVAKGS